MCSGLHWNHVPISGPQGVRTFKSMLKNTMLQGGVCVAFMEGELLLPSFVLLPQDGKLPCLL